MNEMQQEILRAKELIDRSHTILIIAHKNVDGDAYGAVMALYYSLSAIGKDVCVVNELPVAPEHHYIASSDIVKTEISNMSFDCIIFADCGDFHCIGRFAQENQNLFERVPIINIDHHGSNELYGTINIVDPHASSTCEILYSILTQGFPMDERVHTCLLYGIIRDTNCFKNSLSSNTFHVVAELYDKLPARVYDEIVTKSFKSHKLNYHQLYGEIMTNLIVLHEGRVIGGVITEEMMQRHGIIETALGKYFINEVLPTLDGTHYIFLLRETPDGTWKVSFRAREEGYNVAKLAGLLGGGGHYRAGAAHTNLPLDRIIEIIDSTDIYESCEEENILR